MILLLEEIYEYVTKLLLNKSNRVCNRCITFDTFNNNDKSVTLKARIACVRNSVYKFNK